VLLFGSMSGQGLAIRFVTRTSRRKRSI